MKRKVFDEEKKLNKKNWFFSLFPENFQENYIIKARKQFFNCAYLQATTYDISVYVCTYTVCNVPTIKIRYFSWVNLKGFVYQKNV